MLQVQHNVGSNADEGQGGRQETSKRRLMKDQRASGTARHEQGKGMRDKGHPRPMDAGRGFRDKRTEGLEGV